MRYTTLLGALCFVGLAAEAGAQATITIINNDGPGEGFNDPTPVAPVAGNPGTTLGEQRLNAFRAAADHWAGVLTSPVEITVDAAMDPLTPCDALGGVLGRAGTVQVFRDFPNAPQPNTWYPSALANAIAGVDNDTAQPDIQARFNSDIDNNDACLNNTNWFYGIGVATPANTISLEEVVRHEIGHGLGVQSFVDIFTTGQLLDGRADTFSNLLHDHSTDTVWPSMTNVERLTSAVDTGDLHWIGPQVNACANQILTGGMAGGHVRMFAPSPVQPGSSVSHFDTAVDPDELMEPFATPTSDQRLTDRLLADIGWDVTSPTCVGGLHIAALSPIHRPPLTPHFPPASIHLPIGSPIHFPPGSPIHRPPLTPHIPRGSIHLPLGSPIHFPPDSPIHRPPLTPHFPAGSIHLPLGSPIHRPPLTPHFPPGSVIHIPALSDPHNFVSSRFGEIDPRGPLVDPRPFMQGAPIIDHNQIVSFGHDTSVSFGHTVQTSVGHLPLQSDLHGAFNSTGHGSFISTGHIPFLSTGHDFFLSRHHPIVSQGHDPLFSGHTATISGHVPFLSSPHNLLQSQGHLSIVSSGHHPILSNPPHDLVGSRFADPSGPVTNPVQPGAGAQSGGAGQPGAGMERIPGNRGVRTFPGMPPGDPYTVPSQ